MSSRYVALLRGINVGGKNKLPMAKLVTFFEELGCEDVRTYIQSGNLVFSASAALTKTLSGRISARIEQDLGLRVPVLLRSRRELTNALQAHPLAGRGVDEKALAVMFLADRPPAARVRKLAPDRSPGDRFTVVGREVFLLCPNGVARTKLTSAWFDRELATVSTTRNWRTARKLLEMVS